MVDPTDAGGGPIDEKELQRLKEMERRFKDMLDEMKKREEQLRKYDESLRKREQEWDRRKLGEEEKLKRELEEREKALRQREKELEAKIIVQEEHQLKEREEIIREIEEDIKRRHQELEDRRRRLGLKPTKPEAPPEEKIARPPEQVLPPEEKVGPPREQVLPPEPAEPEAPAEAKVVEMDERTRTDMVTSEINKEIEGLPEDAIVIVTTKSENHMKIVLSLLRITLAQRHWNGVYISANRPSERIKAAMQDQDIEVGGMQLIDSISRVAGKRLERTKDTVFIDNPSSLEEIGMYADNMLEKMAPPRFVILDALSSLIIYSDPKSVKEFTHFIINKMRLGGIGGFILSVENEEAQELVNAIKPMCDKMIQM